MTSAFATYRLCRRRKPASALLPILEEHEQSVLAAYLDALPTIGPRGWFHPANETQAKPQYLAKRRRLGVKAGVPDVMIVRRPPHGGFLGVAIELKSTLPSARVSDEQREWLAALAAAGWAARVCYGADEAIGFVRELGYEAAVSGAVRG